MKKFSFVLSLCIISSTFSQSSDTIKKCNYKFQSLSFTTGFYATTGVTAQINDLTKISNESTIAKEMFDLKDSLIFSGIGNQRTQSYFSFDLQFVQSNPKRFQSRISIGFDGVKMGLGELYGYKSEAGRYDTLTSSSSGEEYYIDTLNSLSYYYSGSAQMVGLRLGYQIEADYKARLHFFAGVNYVFRFSTQARASIGKSEYTYSSNGSFEQVNNQSQNYRSISNDVAMGSPIMQSLSIPMGLDFRLSKSNSFFKNLHLQACFEPGLFAINNSKFNNYFGNFALYQAGLVVDFP
ncbi:MAG: hypothetical protein ACI9XP_000304 [Lentimonas sp.]|jgi:hypothetical protein